MASAEAGGGAESARPGAPAAERVERVERVIVRPRRRGGWRRDVLIASSTLSALVLLVMIAMLVLTGTDWGRERVRRFAEVRLNNIAHGRVRIGKLTGNLLVGMTVHNFSITDSTGAPFVAVQSFSGDYSIWSLWRKQIWISNAVVVRPLIVLDKPPDGVWNWQRIFPRDTTPKPPSQQVGWGDWIRFTNSQVVNGQVVIRSAWHPAENLNATARDSAIRDVLSGRSRLMVHPVKGGFQKIVQLDSVTAAVPFLRLSEPGYRNRLAQISALSMVAYPFRPPGAVVRDLKGSFPFNNDSLWWKGAYAAMPKSRFSGNGSYQFNTGDMWLTLHGEPADFSDLRWVYPRLPSNGHGAGDMKISWKGAVQDYYAYDADVSIGAARVRGHFGLRLSDTLTIHDSDVRFTNVDTRLIEQLVPHFTSPRRGTLAGHAKVNGGRHALVVDADVTFADQRAGTSRVAAVGEVGFLEHGLRARNLRMRLKPLQVELARSYDPTLPISGVVTGTALINGSTDTELAIQVDVAHRDRGVLSAANGKAIIRLASGKKYIDVAVNAHPLSLVEIGRFFPAAGLRGNVAGPVHIVGTPSNLRVNADLLMPNGGRLTTQGTLALAGTRSAYDLAATLVSVDLSNVLTKAPTTHFTGRATVRGRGLQLATMDATIAADLAASRWDTLTVDRATVRAQLANGLAQVQRLDVRAGQASATASGDFGLTRGRTGTLTFHVTTDSLGAFARFLPKSASDTGVVAPRPRVLARAIQRARADSARIDRATEIERMISGKPAPRLVVRAPRTLPRGTLSGSLVAAGTLHGNIYDFDLRGRAAGKNIIARGDFVHSFESEFAWNGARTAHSNLIVAVNADSVAVGGFWFDTAAVRLSYGKPNGHVEIAIRQGGDREYGLRGDFALNPSRNELRIASVTLRFDTAYWAAPHPALVQWGGPGIQVTDFELRNRGNGRVYANGLLPTKGVADFTLDVDNFPVANIVDLLQSDISATGLVTIHGSMTGTMNNPAFRGAFGVLDATYNGTPVPELHGRFGYADEELVTHVDALRNGGASMAVLDGRFPINLALSGVTGPRLLPRAMSMDLVADSLPLELIPQFTDLVQNVHGRAAGKIVMRGTLQRPSLVGSFFVDQGTVQLTSTGATFDAVRGVVRMANDTVYVDSVTATAKGGRVMLRGSLAVGNWREPAFNLYLVARGAELLHNQWGHLSMDAGLALTGPFNNAYLSGQVDVLDGVINAPEPTGRHVISAGDPALFNVVDTAVVSDRSLFPAESPLLANLRVEVGLNVRHNTWVRNREANVEIYTEFPMMVRAEQQALALTGVVTTDRGEYEFMSKRFQIKRGSAMFIGSPDLNPTLQVTGEYQVQVAARGALNIRVLIGGTLRRPRLSLESDAQPPKTQSELLSLLAFGQSTTSLLAINGSSIPGSAAVGDLFGVGAQLAVRRLAGVALGVLVNEVESEAGKALGTDVLDITPADVPTELTQAQGLGNFLTQTKVEAGKYINPRTFVTAQEQGGRPGAGIEHRTADGWQFRASFEPRLLLEEPTLSKQPFKPVRAYGGLIAREWRF